MKRTPLEIVDLAGSPLEVAFGLGRLRAKKIHRALAFWERSLDASFRRRGGREKVRRLEKAFLAKARALPRTLEEVRALAEGAGVPFEDLFRLNLTELRSYAPRREDEKCTTLILPIREGRNWRILLAHNEDWDPRRNDVFLLRARLPGIVYATVAYDGYLPGLSTGLNSAGLHHAVNYLAAPDPRVGLPRIFVTRQLVTATSIESATAFIARTERAYGQSIHLAQGDRYLGIELTARKTVLRAPDLPTVHTNHYLVPALARRERPSPSSRLRLEAAEEALAAKPPGNGGYGAAEGRTLARRILSDRSRRPYAVWREADSKKDPGATLAAALHATGDGAMEVFRRRPDRATSRRVSIQ